MTECTCLDIKALIHCNLTRGENPCISTTAEPAPAPEATPEPPALNSDALTNSLASILGTNTTITNEL
ncbi:hypothetical protein [Arthrobacter sp. 754]|uniref:hypothetical protein n=1 Tax=Arthrobacter sp. 754 TaxID=3156315 RepID=UPI00339106EE